MNILFHQKKPHLIFNPTSRDTANSLPFVWCIIQFVGSEKAYTLYWKYSNAHKSHTC